MKTLRLLLLCLLLSPVSGLLTPRALGATVTGLIEDTTGNALTNSRVIFQPLGRPAVNGGALLTSLAGSITTGPNGTFTNSLAPGDYTVVVAGRDRFTISVPNDSSTNSLVDLISTALQYSYTVPPSVYPVATTVRSGTARTDTTVADPVVYLSSTVDSLLAPVSATATAALPKAGGTLTGALVLAANASAALNPVAYQQLRSTNNIVAWAAATAYQPSGTITRDGNGIITGMAVKWPDGAAGLFTGTPNASGFGVDAYTLTYILGGTTNTVTQATVTRDGAGNVTTAPTLTFQ